MVSVVLWSVNLRFLDNNRRKPQFESGRWPVHRLQTERTPEKIRNDTELSMRETDTELSTWTTTTPTAHSQTKSFTFQVDCNFLWGYEFIEECRYKRKSNKSYNTLQELPLFLIQCVLCSIEVPRLSKRDSLFLLNRERVIFHHQKLNFRQKWDQHL